MDGVTGMGSRWDWEDVKDSMGRLGKIRGKKGSVAVLVKLKNRCSDDRRVRGCKGVRLRSESGRTEACGPGSQKGG